LNERSYPVKRREELTLRIEKLAFGGKGLTRLDDYVIFVDKSLPGDLVKARIYKRKRNHAQAKLIEILEPSSLRQDAPCPYFGWCGGCTWQNLSYADQIRIKGEQVAESIQHIAGLEGVQILETLPSPHIWEYRNKMEFSFSDRRWLLPDELGDDTIRKDFALGLHIPGTFDKILEIDHCLLQSESANQVLRIVTDYCKKNNLKPYGIHSREGYLRFLVIRQSHTTSEIMVNIVTHDQDQKILKPLAAILHQQVPEVACVVNNINTKRAQVAIGEEEILLSGKPQISDQIGQFVFDISANSFFQTNTKQAERLYQIVIDFAQIQKDDIVWDLYAGTGAISLFLAQEAGFVYAFEIVESAVRDGKYNAKRYGTKNIQFISGDIIENFSRIDKKPQIVVVDPPRAGMHPKVCQSLSQLGSDKIVYVSCNPTTLARDLEILATYYQVKKIQPIDMFPHTYHIESVALLESRK
jgi:23S rRNA (uracil1939-C5)-methyltransferase